MIFFANIFGVFVLLYLMTSVISQPPIMKAINYAEGQGPEHMSLAEFPVPDLREKEILIKVYSSAINRADTLQRKGLYTPPEGQSKILGLEATGKVIKLSSDCSDKWKVGDRVMVLVAGGGNAEYVAAHEDHLMPVPKGWKFNDAAAIPEVWITAYQLIFTEGQFQPGDSVLIHAGGSGVGTAATQLVSIWGGVPIVTAGSQSKLDKAKSLGAAACYNYKEGNFDDKVLNFTQGKGVRMILDCVGGSFCEQNARCIGIEGRWMLYGLLGGRSVNGNLFSSILRKRVNLRGSTLRARNIEYKASLIKSFTQSVLPLFESGDLGVVVDSVFPLEKLGDAHKKMESNLNVGKIIIQVQSEDEHDEL
ncbi:quinone oxidoreductase PIG3-like [Tubulanus polymorphus]|uniref:quinone oxidoreductase PIG3-like n=1 Tax=Tubulanus polymorphus TaxID=672921 RepID=UPI003DA2E8CA